MMRRSIAVLSALTVASAACVAVAPSAAAVPVTAGATAYSSAAASGTGALSASLTLTGAVGGLLNGLISPIVADALNPLVAALQGAVNGVVASTIGAASSSTAGTPGQQATTAPGAFPGDLPSGLPSPCTASSAATPCYRSGAVGVAAAPLATLGISGLSGYTQQTATSADAANATVGRAQVLSPSVSALAGISTLTNPVVSAGVVDGRASCPNAGSSAPTASVSATSVTLLGGLVRLNVLNGAIAGLVVNGTTYGTLASLPVLTVAGVRVQSYGTAVRVDVPLTLDQLVAGLGLPTAAVTELLNDATSATLKLSVIVGPTTSVTATTARAAGLNIGLDLSGAVKFSLLGLAGATVALVSGIGGGNYGNVLDVRLGYATCQSGSSTLPGPGAPIPAGLV